jgi:hypothetical protein
VTKRIGTYREFWPYYLREHSAPATRAIHLFGTAIATASFIALIWTGKFWFLLGALLGGYGPAWFAHFFVEHNRPATFSIRCGRWFPITGWPLHGLPAGSAASWRKPA